VKLRKVFRFRMDPTPEQRESLARMAGARRFVWNWALNQRKQHYATTGKGLPAAELSRGLTALKRQPELAWLKEADSQASATRLYEFLREAGALPTLQEPQAGQGAIPYSAARLGG
jgi:transposase